MHTNVYFYFYIYLDIYELCVRENFYYNFIFVHEYQIIRTKYISAYS